MITDAWLAGARPSEAAVRALVAEVRRLRQREAELLEANNAELERRRQAEAELTWLERRGVTTGLHPGQRISGVHYTDCVGSVRLWCAHQVGSEFRGLREAARAAMAWEEAHSAE